MGTASPTWWGTLAFMLIEGTGFALAIAVYLYLMSLAPTWPIDAPPPDLLAGHAGHADSAGQASCPNYLVSRWAEQQDLRKVRIGLVVMSMLGIVPLVVRVFEFPALHVSWDTNAYGSIVWIVARPAHHPHHHRSRRHPGTGRADVYPAWRQSAPLRRRAGQRHVLELCRCWPGFRSMAASIGCHGYECIKNPDSVSRSGPACWSRPLLWAVNMQLGQILPYVDCRISARYSAASSPLRSAALHFLPGRIVAIDRSCCTRPGSRRELASFVGAISALSALLFTFALSMQGMASIGVERMRKIGLHITGGAVFGETRRIAHELTPHMDGAVWTFDPWIVVPLLLAA